jgi:hypothetical protein
VVEGHGNGGAGIEARVASQAQVLAGLSGRLEALEERTRVVGEEVAGLRVAVDSVLTRLDRVHSAPCPFLQRHVELSEARAQRSWARETSRLWSLVTIFLSACLGGFAASIAGKLF